MEERKEEKDFDIVYSEYYHQFLDVLNGSPMPLCVTISILKELLQKAENAMAEKIKSYNDQKNKEQEETAE